MFEKNVEISYNESRSYNMDILDQMNIKELKQFQKLLLCFETIDEAIEVIGEKIKQKEVEKKESCNVRFNLKLIEKLQILTNQELKVVKEQGVTNLQELIDLNLDLIPNISSSMKKSLDEKRKFYDLSCYDKQKKR
jgi:hypothetical protein